MKKLTLFATLLIGGSLLLPAASVFADSAPYGSKGKVEFTENGSGTKPIDPTDPGHEVKPGPEDPQPGTNGPLSIDFASSLDFGKQNITSTDATYKASLQYVEQGAAKYYVPNFVQVTDNRGEATPSGWALSVKQEAQFAASATSNNKVLDGATISFKNGAVQNPSSSALDTDFTSSATMTLTPGQTFNFLNGVAGKFGATGMTQMVWGDKTQTPVPSDGSLPTSDAITLFVPGKTSKVKDVYTTNLTWNLAAVPGNLTPNTPAA